MVSAKIFKLPTAARDLPAPAQRHRPRAQSSRLPNDEIQARFRKRRNKNAASYNVDGDDLALEMLKQRNYIPENEIEDTAEGKRKIGEALSQFIADCVKIYFSD